MFVRSWLLRVRWWAAALVIGVYGLAWWMNPAYEMSGFVTETKWDDDSDIVAEPEMSRRFVSSDLDDFVHSSSITALPGGNLMSVWFAGSREGAADVQIRAARFDAASGEWGDEEVLATRELTRQAVGKPIRKLGNPVIALAPDDRLWLFYVSVSLGGWAGSAINVMVSEDLGTTWSVPRQLITSPFINISTLVRSAPVFHQDGSIGLPVYHEFLGKFPEYLYLDSHARVVDKFRMADGDTSLQPTVVTLDDRRAIALLRYAGREGHVLATVTADAGQTWSEERAIEPWNPNSSLAAIRSHRDTLLVAQNNLADGRFRLTLDESTFSLSTWSLVKTLDESTDAEGDPIPMEKYVPQLREQFIEASGPRRQVLLDEYVQGLEGRVCKRGLCDFEYEYPYIVRSDDGRFHMVYSWNNSFIKHVTFNRAWVEEQE
ncbi:sialidase family protein [Halopseudomonas pelagia]|uniref:sialidase family protein n=1 Tax=Halopseudomonas pelagia TaxID=553151 RepID=UPI0003A7B34A|tara:strand:- start:168489 stop:169784 length:1296 start_codon:yes stop_codon:yes gene_type:complete